MVAASEHPLVRFEDLGDAPEIWGSTQANFMVSMPGRHAIEAAVLLNDPLAAYLAAQLGVEDTAAFRAAAAQELGRAWIEMLLARGSHIPPIISLSRSSLESEPALLAAVLGSGALLAQ